MDLIYSFIANKYFLGAMSLFISALGLFIFFKLKIFFLNRKMDSLIKKNEKEMNQLILNLRILNKEHEKEIEKINSSSLTERDVSRMLSTFSNKDKET